MLPSPIEHLRTLPPYVFAELERLKSEARARGAQLIELGIGSPDAGIPAPIIEALVKAARDPAMHGYPPFRGLPKFLDAAARFVERRFGTPVDPARNIIALSGSKEGLAQVAMAYCGPGDVALVPNIYYPVHARAPLLGGADVHHLPLSVEKGFLPNLDAIPAEVLRRAKLLILNYPNNPTGAVATRTLYERAVALAQEHNLIVVSDLAYSELTFDGYVAPSVFEVPGAMDVAVEFHSGSKNFSMAGMRIGFAVGNAAIIDTLAAYRTNIGYGTPTAIQHAVAYALDHAAELTALARDRYQRRRDAVVTALREIDWPVTPPKGAMYVWLPVPEGYDDWTWTRTLLDRAQVVVTPGIAFGPGGAGYFRISLVADEPVLAEAVRRMGECLASAAQAG